MKNAPLLDSNSIRINISKAKTKKHTLCRGDDWRVVIPLMVATELPYLNQLKTGCHFHHPELEVCDL